MSTPLFEEVSLEDDILVGYMWKRSGGDVATLGFMNDNVGEGQVLPVPLRHLMAFRSLCSAPPGPDLRDKKNLWHLILQLLNTWERTNFGSVDIETAPVWVCPHR